MLLIDQRPPSSPPCWGRQYDESDKECVHQCEYRLSCKPAFFRTNNTPGAVSLPMYPTTAPPLPQPTWPQVQSPFTQQPQPVRLGMAQSPVQTYNPLPAPPMAMAFQQPHIGAPPMPQMAAVTNAITTHNTLHSPYFTQYYSPYPGETVLERLGKHIILRLGQILFHEAAAFLGLWRWPPNR